MLRKLGRSCAFAGKVGDDMFGQQLRAVVEEAGICGDYLVTDRNARTTLAFVKKLPNGDRDFSFFRNPGADMMLTEAEVPGEVIGGSRIFHFGTLSMTKRSSAPTFSASPAHCKARRRGWPRRGDCPDG